MNATATVHRFRTHDALIAEVSRLACEAGENGCPLLETGLTLIVQGSRYPLAIRSLLTSIGMMQLTVMDKLAKGDE